MCRAVSGLRSALAQIAWSRGAAWSARRPVKPEVAGSNPVGTAIRVSGARPGSGRATRSGRSSNRPGVHPGRVAQLAERPPEKRKVTGSTPVPTTTTHRSRTNGPAPVVVLGLGADGSAADAVRSCGGRAGPGDRGGHQRVEHRRDDVVGSEVVAAAPRAMASAAATFMFSVIFRAPASSAPRKTPGKASTLLIWFGKSERPVAMTAATSPDQLGPDLGVGVRHGEHDRVGRHADDVVAGDQVRSGQPDEHVRARHDLGERTGASRPGWCSRRTTAWTCSGPRGPCAPRPGGRSRRCSPRRRS